MSASALLAVCLVSYYGKTNSFDTFNALTLLAGRQEEHPTLKH